MLVPYVSLSLLLKTILDSSYVLGAPFSPQPVTTHDVDGHGSELEGKETLPVYDEKSKDCA